MPQLTTILTNARILTMDPARPFAQAVAIAGGRFTSVGDTAEVLRGRDRGTRVIDLGGRCVLPGIVDAHNHFGPTSLDPMCVDVSPTATPDIVTMQARIAAMAAQTPVGGWIRAVGYSDIALAERRHPTRWELDEAAPEHAVVAIHGSYHRAVANSRALELAGIVAGHTYRPGGVIECDPAGEPIGVLAETATNPFQRMSIAALIERHADTLLDLVEANARRHLALGITALQDAWVSPDFHALLTRAAEVGKLPLYWTPLRGSARGLFDSPAAWFEGADFDASTPPHVRRGGIKLFADGAGVTAATRIPGHGGEPHGVDEGILFFQQHELDSLAERAARHNLTIAVHAIGNRAIDAALDASGHVRRSVPSSESRIRLEHFFWGTEETVQRVASLGVGIVAQPVGIVTTGDRPAYRNRPRTFLDFPLAALQAAGVPVAGSSDSPCFPLSPWVGIAAAVERVTAAGRPLSPDQALTVHDAIRAYTLGSAWAGGSEHEEGSITPGKLANLAILPHDPTTLSPTDLRALAVDETWVDGLCMFSNRSTA